MKTVAAIAALGMIAGQSGSSVSKSTCVDVGQESSLAVSSALKARYDSIYRANSVDGRDKYEFALDPTPQPTPPPTPAPGSVISRSVKRPTSSPAARAISSASNAQG